MNETAAHPPTPDHLPGIMPQHLEKLRACGLTDDTIKAGGFYSEKNARAIAAKLNRRDFPKKCTPALMIPYTRADGTNGYERARPDRPRVVGGKTFKYESPSKHPNEIYLPPHTRTVLDNPACELLFTEGEFKSAAADQYGYACIGLVGVHGWSETKSEQILPALEHIEWRGRSVRIVFDSDLADKPEVADAESRLADALVKRGAKVKVVRLPAGPHGEKVGLDDYLVAHGPAELRKLLDSADDPAPVDPAKSRMNAQNLDPATEGTRILDSGKIDGMRRLLFWRAAFWWYSRGRYIERQTSEVRGHVVCALNTTYRHLTTSIVGNVMEQLRAQAMLPFSTEPPAWLGEPPRPWNPADVLVASNALVNLLELVAGQECIIEPTPRFFSTSALDYDFAFDAPAPVNWLEFLNQLWPDDSQSIEALQEWFGYTLTADTRQQKILMLVGPKRSGKGTIARVQGAMIGQSNVAGPTLASFATNFGLWPLLGKTLAIVSDARLSGRTDQAVVVERLLAISGEDALTVDRKNLEPVTAKLSTRLMILSNELPRLGDASGALTSRMILLRLFRSFYGSEDHHLTDKLLPELPGILLWAIEGWRRLRERGRFVQPDSALELLGDLADLASPVGQFAREQCIVEPGRMVPVKDLFAAWQAWAEGKGRKDTGTEQTFGRDLLAAFPQLSRTRPRGDEGERYRAYEGIGLKTTY